MILPSAATVDSLSWQEQLSTSIRTPEELFRELALDPSNLDAARAACRQFPLQVPRAYLRRIEKGNPDDPLLKQILPVADELLATPGYSSNPLAENLANPVPGVIHKYRGRVLLISNPNCAINCRYCFRRHFDYDSNRPTRHEWRQALDYIRNDSSIAEVIYSGGDPLAASDRQLQWLTRQIAEIPHVQRLRIHTRLPIVIPDRITNACLNWLTGTRLRPIMVIHCNHPREIDTAVASALTRLAKNNVILYNQTVLLKGVNDSAETLSALSEALFNASVQPYYLHLLDRVSGAAHFNVDEKQARDIYRQLLQRLPGYMVPRLVKEQAGEGSKTPIL